MTQTKSISPALEPHHQNNNHLICWKSAFAGIIISIMSYMLLATLGAGVLGSVAQGSIESQQHGSALATVSGLWLGLSAIISLFIGSYFTVRISNTLTHKIGAAHGFIVASAFFIILMFLAGTAIGSFSRGLGRLVEGISKGAAKIGANPRVQDTINQALGTNNLKSDSKIVAETLAVRLLQGDYDSAKSYYAFQTGLTDQEVNAKMTQLKVNFDQVVKDVEEKIAVVVTDTGWSLFVTFFVGLLAALIGGRTGAHANVEMPLTIEETNPNPIPLIRASMGNLANERGSAVPYIFAWFLGVPTSILFLVFMLRAIF
jgi:hypothetical protein